MNLELRFSFVPRRYSNAAGTCFLILAFAGGLASAVGNSSPTQPSRSLSIEERVAAQTAIEEILWSHRIWPKENPGPKPPLQAVLSQAAIRDKVTDYLKKANALERLWKRPITAEQLQAEMERIAKHSQQPRILREIFAALHDDPFLISECLARPTLADRLLRTAYAWDRRFHDEVRRGAESELARFGAPERWKGTNGRYEEITWRCGGKEGNEGASPEEFVLSPSEYDARVAEIESPKEATLRSGFSARGPSAAPQVGIQEGENSFRAVAVLRQTSDSARIATLTWDKTPFDTWWKQTRISLSADVAVPDTLYAAVDVASASCPDDTWRPIPASAPGGRTNHTAVWTGTEMIVWGGRLTSVSIGTSSGGRYDPVLDLWTPTFDDRNPAHVPAARESHIAVWTGSRMIVWGGGFVNGGFYDPGTDTWDLDMGDGIGAPTAGRYATAVWTGSEMIVWGGFTGTTALMTGSRYNPAARTWTPTSTGSGVPSPRLNHTAVWTGSEMIVWGGEDAVGNNFNSGGRYNPVQNTWIPTSTGAGVPAARSFHTSVWTGSQMIVWGGTPSATIDNQGARYDPASDSWEPTAVDASKPTARFLHTAVWTGTEMIVWGGESSYTVEPGGGRYDPATNSWRTVSSMGAPADRAAHTAVWTGSEMIVWGGGQLLRSGGRYDPQTDTWFPTSAQASAGARTGHTSIWTGAEMIVWGGWDIFGNAVISASRYDAATSSWTPLYLINAPPARGRHSAAWTGTEMIVWGGYVWPDNTGGRYNPVTDRWHPTSTAPGVPEGRYFHTAVWTGAEMIVWGGTSGHPLASGARYDPGADAWAPTSSAGAPAPRRLHTAIWTGSEMIVWGGDDYAGFTPAAYRDTGGRYDAATDTWTATSVSGDVPEARAFHTAVWDGQTMIVWGGSNGSVSLATGARYDPLSDSWISTHPAPIEPRRSHAAVWTGHEMIVFGGYVVQQLASSNGRYSPSTDSWTVISGASSVYLPRAVASAVWTGEEMIVLGGNTAEGIPLEGGARYCRPCDTLRTYYRDSDGDSHGDAALPASSCDASPPGGFASSGSDCSDLDPFAWAVPAEVEDLGVDASQPTAVAWSDQAATAGPGTTYDLVGGEVANSGSLDFKSATYLVEGGPNTFSDVRPNPLLGKSYWYLSRGRNSCTTGTYGSGSFNLNRDGKIPPSP